MIPYGISTGHDESRSCLGSAFDALIFGIAEPGWLKIIASEVRPSLASCLLTSLVDTEDTGEPSHQSKVFSGVLSRRDRPFVS
jgi:hypothetical protein